MFRRIVTSIILCGIAAGCATRRGCNPSCIQAVVGPPAPETQVVASAAFGPAIEVGPLPELTPNEELAPAVQGPWWTLTSRECQCIAAQQSRLGNLLDQERRWISHAEGDASCSFEKAQALQSKVLGLQAVQERNLASERALMAYYGLVEVILQRQILEKTRDEIEGLNEAIELVRRSELSLELDATEGLRRLAEAMQQGGDFFRLERRLNTQLKFALGVRTDESAPIWPQCRLEPATDIAPEEAAITQALQCRADLAAVRALRRGLDADTLSTARSALGTVQSALGADLKAAMTCIPSCLTQALHRDTCDDEKELAARCAQLLEVERQVEDSIREQVRHAMYDHQNGVRRAVLAQRKVDAWRTRVQQLDAERQAGESTGASRAQAVLMQYAAESEVLHEIVAVEMARVRLLAAEGQLAAQCGYGCCARHDSP